VKKILVHGYMVYKCDKCGQEFRMWCEKGVEDGPDTLHSVPSPFGIRHTCGGWAKDITGLYRINKPKPNPFISYDAGLMLLPDNENYFGFDKGRDCAVTHLI